MMAGSRSLRFPLAIRMVLLCGFSAAWFSVAAGLIGLKESRADELQDRVAAEERERIETIKRARAASVAVFSSDGRGGGSGVLLTPDGYCVTNFHVVKPCGPFMKCGLDNGQVYDAVIVGIDATGDLALIRLLGRDDFPTAELADSDQVRIGQACFAVGNPFLLATNLQPTVTWGLVSGVRRYQYPAGTLLEYTDCIQTDASINPGNSGGPLFDRSGRVIGINGRISIEKRARVNVGVGYAISSNQVRHFYGALSSGRIVDHATLGATVETGRDGRVVIDAILEGTDAYRRGLRYGDEIASFGGRSIDTVNGFKNVLGIFPKGWHVPLTFDNSEGRVETRVRLEGLHSEEELIELVQGPAQREAQEPNPAPEGEPDPDSPQAPPTPPDGEADPHAALIAELPPEVTAWYQPRRGFANYHFNQLHQDRLLQRYSSSARATQRLQITLVDPEGGEVELALGPEVAAWRAGSDVSLLDFEQDLSGQLGPGTSGLLLAVYHWQRLMVGELRRTGSVVYLGTAPGISPTDTTLQATHDVLSGTLDSVETEFYFDLSDGRLAQLEMLADDRVDACRLIFGDEREVEEQRLPFRWTVMQGELVVGEFTVKSYRWVDPSANATEGGQP